MGGQKKAPSQTGVKGLSSSLKWAGKCAIWLAKFNTLWHITGVACGAGESSQDGQEPESPFEAAKVRIYEKEA